MDRRHVIGLGSNLGDRRATLAAAASAIAALGRASARSALYRADPVGPPQPDFLNAAILLYTAVSPRGLLDALLEIERKHGRVRAERWGPRTLDLDLLWIEGVSVDQPGLTVPHPGLEVRVFALRPLLDVAPDACAPVDGRPYAELLAALDAGGIERIADGF